MRIVKPCRPSAATDPHLGAPRAITGDGEARRTPAGPDNGPRKGYMRSQQCRLGQSSDSNRNSSGMPKPVHAEGSAYPNYTAGPRSHREQAIARPEVWAAT